MNLGTYQLGRKTFWLFILKRCQQTFAAGFLVIFLLLLIGSFTIAPGISEEAPGWMMLGAEIALGLFVLSFGIAFLIAWLEYKNFQFILEENGLKVRRGIINKEEIAMPYRQIQNVNISRDLTDQMLGLARIEILSGGEENPGEKDEAEGILPSLDVAEAESLQAELLKRANIEQVQATNSINSPN